jgi:hypothetical protein
MKQKYLSSPYSWIIFIFEYNRVHCLYMHPRIFEQKHRYSNSQGKSSREFTGQRPIDQIMLICLIQYTNAIASATDIDLFLGTYTTQTELRLRSKEWR